MRASTVLVLLLCSLAGLAPRAAAMAGAAPAPSWPRARIAVAARPAPPHVLLAAIGDEQPVFDRFVADLAKRLETLEVASVTTLSASGRAGGKLNAPADVYEAVRTLRAGRPGGCLIYLTGHGTKAGLSLPLHAAGAPSAGRAYAALDPVKLAVSLRQGCGEAPTVVVLSACYSGVYVRPGMTGATRIVLTAAAPDRTSFGCGNDDTHTYYDGCFLRSLDGAQTWSQLAGRTADCVGQRERELRGVPPSLPQASFGSAVRGLSLPPPRMPRP